MSKKYKILIGSVLVLVVIIALFTAFSFFLTDIIKIDADAYSNFIGNVLGAMISGIITLVVLFITIKHGNKNQEKVLNEQSALHMENNLLHRFEKEKELISESVNELDILLFSVQILKVSGPEGIVEERKNLIDIFSYYRKAMNVIKLSTNIYIDTSKCDGCTECDIKSFGELSKLKTKLRECFNKVEYNCNLMFQDLQSALDECIDTQNLLTQRTSCQKDMILRQEQIQNYKKYNELNPDDNEILKKLKQYEEESTKLLERIKAIDDQIQIALNRILDKNEKARSEASRIQICDKNELYNAIMKYFDMYNFYVRENKNYVIKNGTIWQNICKKYKLD